MSMNFVSFRELRTSTARISEMLTGDGKIVVTSNGKPKAIMIQVDEANLEETLAMLNQVRLARTIKNIRAAAKESGAAKMTPDDINAEIIQSRKERKHRPARSTNE
jgi:PHD/YefM family antitoxin component YafN of YafNO toxin-antitoxin module